jgi:hypothetical protein
MVPIRLMNDFPMPEDPPVMTTAAKFLRAVSGSGIWGDVEFASAGGASSPRNVEQ